MPRDFGKPACTFDLSVIRLASIIRDIYSLQGTFSLGRGAGIDHELIVTRYPGRVVEGAVSLLGLLWAAGSWLQVPMGPSEMCGFCSVLVECGEWRAGVGAVPSSLAWKVGWMVLSDGDTVSRGCGGRV